MEPITLFWVIVLAIIAAPIILGLGIGVITIGVPSILASIYVFVPMLINEVKTAVKKADFSFKKGDE